MIFEDEFLSSFFKDPLFVQHLSFFNVGSKSVGLHLSNELYVRMLQLLSDIKTEIDSYKQNDVHVLRALLYEALMLLDRAYQKMLSDGSIHKEANSTHLSKFMEWVGTDLREHHSVRYYADKLCITPKNKVMEEAKRLLVYTDFPISEIAFELHFSTVSYFVRCFRQSTGETPLAYRSIYKP